MSLLVILGKTCSGKTTLLNDLIEDHGVQKIVTYTTRPMRPNEIDGVDYNFISQEEFEQKKAEGFFLESNDYTTRVNGVSAVWSYGSSKDSYREAEQSEKVYAVILTRSGLRALKDSGIEHTSVFLNVSDEELKNRQVTRGDNTTEAERRLAADGRDFLGIAREVDYVFDGEHYVRSVVSQALYDIIEPRTEREEEIERS